MEHGIGKGRSETVQFPGPVVQQRSRGYQQEPSFRKLLLLTGQIGQDFQGLSQPHVIGQTHAESIIGQGAQPGEACFLVGTEGGLDSFRNLQRSCLFRVAQPVQEPGQPLAVGESHPVLNGQFLPEGLRHGDGAGKSLQLLE